MRRLNGRLRHSLIGSKNKLARHGNCVCAYVCARVRAIVYALGFAGGSTLLAFARECLCDRAPSPHHGPFGGLGYKHACTHECSLYLFRSINTASAHTRKRTRITNTQTHTNTRTYSHTNVPPYGKCPMLLVVGPEGGRLLRIDTGVTEYEDAANGQSSPELGMSFFWTFPVHGGSP
jgi:hypothetical protein